MGKKKFIITNDEYLLLDQEFGKLCCKASWELMRKNVNRSSYYDIQDVISEVRWNMVMAGMYFKRQTYIEKSLKLVKKYCKDDMNLLILEELCDLWNKRKHHGANRKKFGELQEEMLDKLLVAYVPENKRPSVNDPLVMNKRFEVYVKSIIWNRAKFIGKQFTKDNHIRSGSVSLSEKEFFL